MSTSTATKQTVWRRHHRLVVAFAIVILGAGLLLLWQSAEAPTATPVATEQATSTLGAGAYVLPAAEPTRLRIPRLTIDVTFEAPLGLNPDQTIEVPDSNEEVGWYKFGPTPGELGPAVVLGHVDSHTGPAVFYALGQLKPGDEIEIDRDDGSTAVFAVTRLERHEQAGFPTEQVYGDIDHAGLRLITCTGTYDREITRYTHNLIVFAELVGEKS